MCKSSDEPPKSVINQKWTLKERPDGLFSAERDVELKEEEIPLNETGDYLSCEDEEVIVRVETLSVDAFIRTMLDEKAYHGSVAIGQTIPAIGFGTVVAAGSKSNRRVGSRVAGMLGAQEYAKVPVSMVQPMLTLPFLPLSASLGLLGLTTGLTAYVGTFCVSRPPRKGETAVVTAASGAVGCIAAQLAKHTGAKVIGVAGGERKTKYLTDELKLDGAVDYKSSKKTLSEQLDECCPNGVDFVYDSVGGRTLDELLGRIRPKGRIVICGAISQYSGNLNTGKVEGPSNYLKLAEHGAEMKGFNVLQYAWKLPIAIIWMYVQYWRGKVVMPEHIERGVRSFPFTLEKFFNGDKPVGKTLVEVH